MSTFGNINDTTLEHLQFALQAVRGEIGHPLEVTDPVLRRVEKALIQAIKDLEQYRKGGTR